MYLCSQNKNKTLKWHMYLYNAHTKFTLLPSYNLPCCMSQCYFSVSLWHLSVRISLYAEKDISAFTDVTEKYLETATWFNSISSGSFKPSPCKYFFTTAALYPCILNFLHNVTVFIHIIQRQTSFQVLLFQWHKYIILKCALDFSKQFYCQIPS